MIVVVHRRTSLGADSPGAGFFGKLRGRAAQAQRSMLSSMETLSEYDSVKVVRLLQSERPYDGTSTALRAPQIGDTGAIVHIHFVDGKASGYIVENVAPDANTIWLADFMPNEIEKVS